MGNPTTIVCAFCKGTGNNPHFTGTCPVCKGRGENQVTGKVMTCGDCRGTGQKGGTTLTCWTCRGLGVVSDRREEFKKAKKEIEKARKQMDEEREEFREGAQPTPQPLVAGKIFCQCCAEKVARDSTVRVCLDCFRKIKP